MPHVDPTAYGPGRSRSTGPEWEGRSSPPNAHPARERVRFECHSGENRSRTCVGAIEVYWYSTDESLPDRSYLFTTSGFGPTSGLRLRRLVLYRSKISTCDAESMAPDVVRKIVRHR